jgi:protein phosphatase
MKFIVAAFSHQGDVRQTNEDVAMIDGVLVPEQRPHDIALSGQMDHLLAVADGMGGHVAGDIASMMAVEHLAVAWRRYRSRLLLPAALHEANRALYDNMANCPDLKGMGTTIAGAHILRDRFRWFSVGDSRVYLYRDDALCQLSPDHVTSEGELYPAGLLTQCLGGSPTYVAIDPALGDERLDPGDAVLICTDGISGILSEKQITRACAAPDTLTGARRLRAAAIERGAPDNLAFIILKVAKDEDDEGKVVRGSA